MSWVLFRSCSFNSSDCSVPHKDLVAQRDGGAKAAGLLFDFIVKNAESRGYLDAKDRVLVLSFCNSAAFTNRVNDKTYKQNWSAFVTSWNSSGHNVHIIDATGRKEGADFHVNSEYPFAYRTLQQCQ